MNTRVILLLATALAAGPAAAQVKGPGDPVEQAREATAQARAAARAGQFDAAIRHAEAAIAVCGRLPAPQPALCGSAHLIHGQSMDGSRRPEARASFLRAYRAFEAAPDGRLTDSAYALRRAAIVASLMGEWSVVRGELERAIELERAWLRTPEGDTPYDWWEHADTLQVHGRALLHLNDLAAAAISLHQAADIHASHPDPGREQAINTLSALLDGQTSRGMGAAANQTRRRMVEIQASLYGPADGRTLRTYEAIVGAHVEAGEIAEARAVVEHVLPVVTAAFGESSTQQAGWAFMMAVFHRRADENHESIPLFRRAAAAWRDAGWSVVDLIDQNHQLASAQVLVGDLEGLRSVLEDLIAGLEQAGRQGDERYVTALYAYAALLGEEDEEYGTAIEYARRALAQAAAIGMSDPVFEVEMQRLLGGMLLLAGELTEAQQILESALDAARRIGSPTAIRQVLEMLPAALMVHGHARRSLDLVLELAGLIPDDDIDARITVYQQAATLHSLLAEYEAADARIQDALRLSLVHDGERSARQASLLLIHGALLHESGDRQAAETVYRRMMDITAGVFGRESVEYAMGWRAFAGLLYQAVDDRRAHLQELDEIRAMLERIGADDTVFYADILASLGGGWRSARVPERAIQYLERSLEMLERHYPRDHPSAIYPRSDLAWSYLMTGDFERALAAHAEVVEFSRTLYGEDNLNHAYKLIDHGAIHAPLGRHEDLDRYFTQGLAIMEAQLPRDSERVQGVLRLWAAYMVQRGDHERADQLFRRSFDALRGHVEERLPLLSAREQESYIAGTDNEIRLMQSFYAERAGHDPEAAAFLYELALFHKGLRLRNERALRVAIVDSGDLELLGMMDGLAAQRDRIAQVQASGDAKDLAYLPELVGRAEISERELRARVRAVVGEQVPIPTDWRQVQAALGPGEAAVEFLSIPGQAFDERGILLPTGESELVAVLIEPGMLNPRLVRLGPESALEPLLARVGGDDSQDIATLYRALRVAGGGARRDSLSRGAELYRAIWAPVEAALDADTEVVWMSPAGRLHQISFAAIPHPDDGVPMLSDRFRLRQLASTANLAEARAAAGRPGGVTLYGGIDYDAGAWDYLEGTLSEAHRIAGIAERAGVPARQLSGTAATERSIKEMGPGVAPEVLHIATHGFFFEDPASSPDASFDGAMTRSLFERSDNPLYRSGLLFAGGNRGWTGSRPEGQDDDGVLTAYEVANLRLQGTRLVVLSACETGLGDVRGSEGVFGLQRAFRMAGAGALIMSLWKVPDEETAEFMAAFYEAWFSGTAMDEAFETAQSEMKARYPDDPYRWAAFVMVQ